VGEVELDGKILVIRRIHVAYALRGAGEVDAETQAKIDRAHARLAEFCPVARSIRDSIDITTSLEIVSA
jgi:organic hydroperoxide reductase OsmC/OhrA